MILESTFHNTGSIKMSSVVLVLLLSLVGSIFPTDSLNIPGDNHRPVSLRDTISVRSTILPATIAGSLGILATTSSSIAKAASTQFEYQPALQGLDYGKPRTSYPDFTQMVTSNFSFLVLKHCYEIFSKKYLFSFHLNFPLIS